MEVLKMQSHFKERFDASVNLKGNFLSPKYFSVSLELDANLSNIIRFCYP